MSTKTVIAILAGVIVGHFSGQIAQAQQSIQPIYDPKLQLSNGEHFMAPELTPEQRQAQIEAFTNELGVNRRFQSLEQQVTALSNAVTAAANYHTRITELERKVAGMQKQITILHGKKADKPTGKHGDTATVPATNLLPY